MNILIMTPEGVFIIGIYSSKSQAFNPPLFVLCYRISRAWNCEILQKEDCGTEPVQTENRQRTGYGNFKMIVHSTRYNQNLGI